MTTASPKIDSARMNLMALLTALAEKAEIDKTITALTRSLADAHGIPASYPPMG
jgi:hypothetical protein